MRHSKFLIIFILLLTNKLSAQDITGLWKGTLYNDTTQQFYRYELAISEEKGKLTGYSHTWFILEDKQYYGVKKVKIKKQDGKIIVEDAELIANNYPVAPAKGVRQLNVLTLEMKDSLMFMTGPFSTNRTKDYRSLTGSINIQRRNDFWQSALVPHLQELGKAKELSFVQEEEKAIAKKEADHQADQAAVAKLEADRKAEEERMLAKSEADRKEKEKQDAAFASVAVNKKDIKTEKVIVEKGTPAINAPVAVNKKIVPAAAEVIIPEKEAVAVAVPPTKKNEIIKPAEKIETKPAPVTPAVAVAAANVDKRNTELQQTVYFHSDSLQLSLYDNGEVDGDTVSVLMNGKIIFSKERMSTNAVRKTIMIDPSQDSIQLVMYAENLGTIAPNTGLLVVKDGKDIYEIRFSGDLKKNAAIVFRRKKQG